MKHYKAIPLALLLLLSACAPQRLQSAQVVDYNHGRPVYQMTGYTDSGEVKPGSSRRHIEYSLQAACPAGINIISVSEQSAHSGCCKFLYWTAKAECK